MLPEPPRPVVWALALAIAGANALPARAAEPDEVLVQVMVDQEILADSMAARPARDGGVMLPLGELALALGLAVTLRADHLGASGWVLREDRTFQLDVPKHIAALGGRALPFDADEVVADGDDIYVDLRELSRWFPMNFSYDHFALLVKVLPLEPLPIQLRRERERRAEQSGAPPVDPKFPFIATPYAWFGQPALDPTVGVSFSRDANGQLQPGLSYATLADLDLLGVNVAGYASGTDRLPFLDWHATAGRKDPDAGLLGPLHAREAAAGYVVDPGMPLVTGTWSGNGVAVSSYPLTQPVRFDRQTFRGPLPPGWDAQLLQNDFPIAYQAASTTGEYRFDDVPLVVGPNEFKIVLNGPQGQRREIDRRFNIGATLTPPGEQRYRVLQGLDYLGRPRTGAVYERGITGQLSAAVGAARLALPDNQTRTYAQGGLRGTLGEVFWHADAAAADDGGVAGQAGVQLAAGPIGVSVDQSLARGFLSEEFRPEDDPIMARSTVRADGRLPDNAWLPATAVLTGEIDRRRSGALSPLIGNQLSTRIGELTLSNALEVDPTQGTLFSDGLAELGGLWRDISLRGQVFYAPMGLTSLALVGSGQAYGDYRWTLTGAYPLGTRLPQITLDLGRLFSGLSVGITTTVAAPGTVTSSLNLSSGLGWTGSMVRASSSSQATTGAAQVRVYVDANQNGRFDRGERTLPGVAVDLGTGVQVITDARGEATATGLTAYQPVDVDFTRIALEDPLLVPALKGARYVPRPGRTTVLDCPVISVGEVYGTVYALSHGKPIEFGGATVELVDAAGHVVQSTVSGLDGYYGLTEIRPGHYLVRIAPEQLANLGMRPAAGRAIAVPGDGAVFDGQDFTLSSQ